VDKQTADPPAIEPAIMSVLDALRSELTLRGSGLVAGGQLDPVLETNSVSILRETFAKARAGLAPETDYVSVDYSSPADLRSTGDLRARQNYHPAESLVAAEVLFGVALPLVVEQLRLESLERRESLERLESLERRESLESGANVDAVVVARALHHAVWRRFPPGAIAYVETIRQRLSVANQESRKRVSRDLHDRVAHGILAGIQRIELSVIDAHDADAAGGPRPEAETSNLREAIAVLRETLDDVQDMATELRQLVGDRTLDEAIRDYVVDSQGEGDAVVVTSHGDARRLAPAIGEEVFTIVREAIRNAREHAGAASIRVALTWTADRLVVVVVDDGGGFASGDVRASALGLVGMQERAEIIGGRLERESSRAGPRSRWAFRSNRSDDESGCPAAACDSGRPCAVSGGHRLDPAAQPAHRGRRSGRHER
jgi:signal transduction histidine kinase